MKQSIFGIDQKYLIQLKLSPDDVIILSWLKSFTNSGKQEYIQKNNKIFYWVKYSKIIDDLPILGITKDICIGRVFSKLCGENKERPELYPLEKFLLRDGKLNKTYFRFRDGAIDRMEDATMINSFSADLDTSKRKNKVNKENKSNLHPNVSEIIEMLSNKKKNGETSLFKFVKPDGKNYTKSIKKFQNWCYDLYNGRFNLNCTNQLSDWFKKQYSYYLTEQGKEKILKCKGNWNYILKLFIEATNNYSKWFDASSEKVNKDSLPKHPSSFIFNPINGSSMFLLCLDKKPSCEREAQADKSFNIVDPPIRKICNRIYNNKMDGLIFWNKIKKIIDWYKKHRGILKQRFENQYFISSINEFMDEYISYLEEKYETIWLKNIGTDCPTFSSFLSAHDE